jgi:hypothetical protein
VNRREAGLLGATLVVGVAHALAIAPAYHVGSFDDDANYVLVARALAHGTGLTGTLSAGPRLIATYPPGYSAVLAPLAAVFGNALWPYRALSLLLLVAVFALTWIWLGRHGLSPAARAAVCLVMALNPVLATYATMVMAELPFIVVLLALVIAAESWREQNTTWTGSAVGVIVAAAALIWFKEAGVGAVAGVAIWLAMWRQWRKAIVALGGVAALVAPLLIFRAIAGTSLIGSRYSDEIGGTVSGGLLHRIGHFPHAMTTLLGTAMRKTLLPAAPQWSKLDAHLVGAIALCVSALVILGFVVWCWRYRDVAVAIVVVYLAETALYPFINERRLVLVLPVLAAFLVVGAEFVLRHLPRVVTITVAAAVALPLLFQFPRDYLYPSGQATSRPSGSPYMAALRELGSPHDVVESDYIWTTALFSGHRTATSAFTTTCTPAAITDALATDHASYLLSAALQVPRFVGNDCVLGYVSGDQAAVRLYRTDRDLASVFELIPAGTRDLMLMPAAGAVAVAETAQSPSDHGGDYLVSSGMLTESWTGVADVRQVSVGSAGALNGAAGAVTIQLRTPASVWVDVVRGPSDTFLYVRLPAGVAATAVRVIVSPNGRIAVHDLHVLAAQ